MLAVLHGLPYIPTSQFVYRIASAIFDFVPFHKRFVQADAEPRNIEYLSKINRRYTATYMRRSKHREYRDTIGQDSEIDEVYLAAFISSFSGIFSLSYIGHDIVR